MYSSIKNFLDLNCYQNSIYCKFNGFFFEVNSFVDSLIFDTDKLNNSFNNYSNHINYQGSKFNYQHNDFLKVYKNLDEDAVFNFYFSKFPEMQVSYISKIFIPKPFNASPSNIYNGLPWFLDYVHLSFWFFFLSIVVSVLFLIYFFTFVWNNQENKYPIRETRGFSRAQTGDTMTAIIPMTWSITMLLHASTHSSNFDENTTGTQFCLTVIAYQWGWNYYYPKDIISIFNNTPIKVGHDNVDYYSNFNENYNSLLDYSRNYILNKNFFMGIGSSKIGKNNIQTLQSLFFKSFDSNQNLELPVSLFISLNLKKNNFKLNLISEKVKKAVQGMDDSLLNYTHNNNDIFFINSSNINNLNNLNFNFMLFLLEIKFNFLTFYKNLTTNFFFKSLNYTLFFNNSINFNNLLVQQSTSNIFLKQFYNNSVLKTYSLDSHKNKNTFFSNSNKLFSIYKFLTDDFFKEDKNLIENIQNKLNYVNNNNMYKKVAAHFKNNLFYSFTLEEFNTFSLNFIDSMSIMINQWLTFNDYTFYFDNQNLWLDFLNFNFLNFNNNFFFINNFKFLNFNDNFNDIFFIFDSYSNIYNFKRFLQSLSYFSSDNSFLFYNNSILTFEDFGFVNSSVIKEFWYKNNIYSNFFYFNLLSYFKFLNEFNYLNFNYFNFYIFNKNFNYKFWEIDSNYLLIQNNIFQQNVVIDNNIQLSNTTFMYSWPLFINDFGKNFKNVFFSYNSILNLLNFNYYSIRSNFLIIRNNIFNNEKFNFISIKFNSISMINNLNLKLFFNIINCNFNFFNISLFLKNDFLHIYKRNFNVDFYYIINSLSLDFNIILNFSKFKYLNLEKFYCFENINFVNKFIKKNNLLFKSNHINKINFNNYNLKLNYNYFGKKNISNLLNFYNVNYFWDIFYKNNNNLLFSTIEKPVRISYKYNDPVNFNFKLSNDIKNIYYNNKYLFKWQINWSNQIKNFNLPLYKFYRGNAEKKIVTGFLDFKNINSSFFDENMLDDYKSTIFKNFCESKRDKNYWSKIENKFYKNNNMLPVIDFEKFNFFKNYLIYLPNVNDDLDVNYILKYLTFDVNTSRRNDHLSKFKVFWGPLFTKYIKKLISTNKNNSNLLNNLNIKNINFFKSYSINLLNFDSFYLHNVSLQKNAFVSSLKILSKYSNMRVNFLKNNFFWNFNSFKNNSLREVFLINNLLKTNSYFYNNFWFFSENNLNYYFINNLNFLNYWSSFWFFKDNLQNFWNKIFFNKNFKDNSDFINKSLLVSSFKSKEEKNIFNNLNFNLDSSLLLNNDLFNILNLYQNNIDIKNNINFSDVNNLNIFSNLNYFKYNNQLTDIYFYKKIKSIYYKYYLLQLQKQVKSRFNYTEINNNIPSIKRLRVSKGICLPSDFNIHIICGSKDVIHSWAIPGLGVKIDAIPGFNSHRRILFRWRGLYWGQCMEVCGRYHHWMPILVRIVHKDLFLVWCLSYLRLLNNKNFKYEKFFFDEILLLNWLSDSSNSIELTKFFNTMLDKKNVELQLTLIETLFLYE